MDIFADIPFRVEDIISDSMFASVCISPAGALIPLLDTAAITGIWGHMLYKIALYHDVTMSADECAKIITGGGSSILGYLGGSKMLNWLLNLIPGVGMLGAMAGNVIFNGYYTYAVGKAFHQMLDEYDIEGKTIREMAKILIHLFVPIPSLDTLKGVYEIMKEKIV